MTPAHATYQIFSPDGCLTKEGMIRFRNQQLTEQQQQQAEQHRLECNLCKDALEGIALLEDKLELEPILSELNEELLAQATQVAGIKATAEKRSRDRMFYFSAAASIILLIGTLFFLEQRQSAFPFEGNTINEVLIAEKVVPPMPKAKPTFSEESASTSLPVQTQDRNDSKATENHSVESERQPDRINKPGVPQELRTPDKALESYLEAHNEKTITSIKRSDTRRIDLATTLPAAYFLSEITVQEARPALAIEDAHSVAHSNLPLHGSDLPGATNPESLSNHFFNPVESMPEFPGGIDGLNSYLSNQLTYPKTARNQKIQGRVLVTFQIDVYGRIQEITVVRGLGGGCDREAVRVIREMPNWKPAYQNGQPVPVQFTLPIHFKMI